MNNIRIRKVKPKKAEELSAWLEFINNSEEAKETLKEEEIQHELHTIIEINKEKYLIMYVDNPFPKETNMDREINKKHREIMKECTEYINNFPVLCDIRTYEKL